MSANRWVSLAAICLVAGIFGYVLGKPTGAELAPQPRTEQEPPRQERSLAQLARPADVSELPEPIAAVVEQALAQLESDPFAALELLQEIENEAEQAEAIIALVGQMDAAGLGALISGFAEAVEHDERHRMFEELFRNPIAPIAIFERWAKLDPDAVVEFVQKPFDLSAGSGAIEMPFMLRALSLAFVAQRDPDRAFGAADKLRQHLAKVDGLGAEAGMMVDMFIGIGIAISDPVKSLRTLRERGASLEVIGVADPIFEMAGPRGAEMLAEVLQFPEGEHRQDILEELYKSWGSYDLSLAMASIDGLPEGTDTIKLIERAMRGALRRDPGSAAQHIGSLPEGKERTNMVKNVVQTWVDSSPVEALNWARQNMEQVDYLSQLRQSAGRLSVEAGKAFVAELSAEERVQLLTERGTIDRDHFAMRMIRENPQDGLAWLEEQGGIGAVEGSAVASILLEEGLDAAISFAADVPEAQSESYLLSVASEAGRGGDAKSIAWALDQGDRAREVAVTSWAKEDPLAALEYAAGHDRKLESKAVSVWAGDDPEAAFRWTVETHSADPEALTEVFEGSYMIYQWGQRDPVAAVESISSLTGEIAAPYVGQVVGGWANNEPARASEYVAENFPDDGIVRDHAVNSLVRQLSKNNPAEAQVWAETISDSTMRAQAIEALQSAESSEE